VAVVEMVVFSPTLLVVLVAALQVVMVLLHLVDLVVKAVGSLVLVLNNYKVQTVDLVVAVLTSRLVAAEAAVTAAAVVVLQVVTLVVVLNPLLVVVAVLDM
tara:strand:- start:196 stop:498 length:303 start_codon:yes stop_codon:yes gene_type:complete